MIYPSSLNLLNKPNLPVFHHNPEVPNPLFCMQQHLDVLAWFSLEALPGCHVAIIVLGSSHHFMESDHH